ncbi:unnamed protein product [Paramecium primaurelia]|uniref:Uncharacterized protein n=1 Tax=Paramecium primaurelia TaxID=5886 RepID=A0A8S1Q3J4_PARPR|nr:unnamed protein product [Paramecium primaurelia]
MDKIMKSLLKCLKKVDFNKNEFLNFVNSLLLLQLIIQSQIIQYLQISLKIIDLKIGLDEFFIHQIIIVQNLTLFQYRNSKYNIVSIFLNYIQLVFMDFLF